MKAKVAERGQVTIPKKLRERLGIHSGTFLEFTEEAGKIIAVKTELSDPVEKFYGALGKGRHADDIINKLRDPL